MPAKRTYGDLVDASPERSRDEWGDEPAPPTLGDRGPASCVATCSLGPEHESVRTAREFATKTLRDWGTVELCDDVELVVSELVTNALHAVSLSPPDDVRDTGDSRGPATDGDRGCIKLKLARKGRYVMCLVTDSSDDVPDRRGMDGAPDLIADAGRGLHLVHAHCRRWGWTHLNDRGKVVWALFRAAD